MPIARRQSHPTLPEQSGVHRAVEVEPSYDDEDLPSLAPIPIKPRPKAYRSMEMPAVRPPADAPGRMLDDTFFDDADPPLALDLAKPQGRAEPLPAMWAKSGSGLHRIDKKPLDKKPLEKKPLDPRPGIVAFAGYGLPPEKLSATPAYAFHVLRRKLSLRSDLRIARMRRLPKRDIELYEAALACADEGAVTKGLFVAAASTVGTLSAIAAAAALLF
ncbi:MAG: hypothetical protein KIT84_22255 [Labilithrix sp.]|nr:hypothetical protein [Labilithrix sp.]MCW5813768.1 hypothetical protein [Labilithrix sp.]